MTETPKNELYGLCMAYLRDKDMLLNVVLISKHVSKNVGNASNMRSSLGWNQCLGSWVHESIENHVDLYQAKRHLKVVTMPI